MATFHPRHDPAPSRSATSARAFRALTIVALAAFALRAQSPQIPNPLIVKSTLPTPGCGAILDFLVADFDSSGQPDFLVVLPTAQALGVAHDPVSPAGGGCTMTPIPTLASPFSAIPRVASLNGDIDAFPDAIVLLAVEGRIIDAYGDGSGGFVFPGTGAYPSLSPTTPLGDFAIGDFNHDLRDDVVVLHFPTSTVEVFLNLPTGWTMSFSHPIGPAGIPPGTGDFDGDGNRDVFWTESSNSSYVSDLHIAYGNGAGIFTPAPAPLLAGTNFFQTFDAVADLDQDGRDDLVIRKVDTIGLPYNIPIVWGAPAGVAPQVTFIPTTYDSVPQLKVVDFDVDGVLDVVIEANDWYTFAPRQILMYRGLGSRQFSAPFLLSSEPVGVLGPILRLAVADVDGDQDQDLLLSTFTAYPVTAYSLQLFDNQTIRAPGCPGTMGFIPSLSVGVATPGNPAFAIGLGSARPSSAAILGVSLAPVPASGCGVAIDLAPALLVLPQGPIGVTTTNPAGQASIALPLPPPPALLGMAFHAQWGVVDPQGSFVVAGIPFALSNARTILVW